MSEEQTEAPKPVKERALGPQQILELNVPSKTGTIHPGPVLKETIRRLEGARLYGYIGMPRRKDHQTSDDYVDSVLTIDTNLISHRIDNLRIEGNFVIGDVTILQSHQGEALLEMWDPEKIKFRYAGISESKTEEGSSNKILTMLKITGIHAVMAEEAA